MLKTGRRTIWGIGLLLVAATFLLPWTSYITFPHTGVGGAQQNRTVVTPYLFFLHPVGKKIQWDEVGLQVGAILFATAGATFLSEDRGRR